MTGLIRRILRPAPSHDDQRRSAATDTLLHDLRTETQVVEAERYLLEKERTDRHWLEKALLRQREREQS